MDWRNKRYFKVILNPWDKETQLNAIEKIHGIKISPYKYVEKLPDETEIRGYYTYLISIDKYNADKIEKQMKEIIPDTAFSLVEEIKRDVSKKYFDIFGNEIRYRRCDINPTKRCNHCMNC